MIKIFFGALVYLNCYLAFAGQVTYQESMDDIVNPERGFYDVSEYKASLVGSPNQSLLNKNDLISKRSSYFTPWQANYQVRTSLHLRHYVLDSFVSSPISSSFLNDIETDFETARQAGVKLILKFSYTVTEKDPPYGDATPTIVNQHLDQLKPLLQNNKDVISTIHQGFIGIWGENYYTDHFGDASSAGDGKIMDQFWILRNSMLQKMLDAVPKERMIQVRYPQLKQRYLYGKDVAIDGAQTLTSATAHKQTDLSRIGFHNDCFLASENDLGTFADYGNDQTSASVSAQTNATLRNYADVDGDFVMVGGETCSNLAYADENDCDSHGGQAIKQMQRFNYTYLNSDYNNQDVNNTWQTQGCMAEIKKKLGYRVVMLSSTMPSSITAGNQLNFELRVKNEGFAAIINKRVLYLILKETTSGSEVKLKLSGSNIDPRFWLPNQEVVVNASAVVPVSITGEFDAYLLLEDQSSNATKSNPAYSIQMANLNTWDSNRGWNKLNQTIVVNENTNPPINDDCDLLCIIPAIMGAIKNRVNN